jgi:hypothetical protein
MAKRALLVGCNYPGEQCELKGSVNDVERMRTLLIKRFGFHPSEILELADADPRARQPTGANIRRCLVSRLHLIFRVLSSLEASLSPEPDTPPSDACLRVFKPLSIFLNNLMHSVFL